VIVTVEEVVWAVTQPATGLAAPARELHRSKSRFGADQQVVVPHGSADGSIRRSTAARAIVADGAGIRTSPVAEVVQRFIVSPCPDPDTRSKLAAGQ